MGRNKEKQREYSKIYRQSERGKQKIKEQHKRYYERNREKLLEYHREYQRKNADKLKLYREKRKDQLREYRSTEEYKQKRKQYYREHKEEMYRSQQIYIARNRKKITEQILKKRKENANKFKEQGQMWCYLPKTDRQNKMIQTLCKRKGFTPEESRKLLEERNWDIKSILEKVIEIYDENNKLITIVHSTKELAEYLGGTRANAETILRENRKKARDKKNHVWIYIVERKDNNEYSRAI